MVNPLSANALRANALHLPLAPSSVDLVITSPPYFGQRQYTSDPHTMGLELDPREFLTNLVTATAEMSRVIKSSGSIWVNLGDKYASYEGNRGGKTSRLQSHYSGPQLPTGNGLTGKGFVRNKSLMGLPWRYAIKCVDELGLILREEVIWRKTNPKPESVKDRARLVHEHWFHFTINDRYYADPNVILRSVIDLSVSRSKSGHPATFPLTWPELIIEKWCPLNGVVLDPFGGSGTTMRAALSAHARPISLDISAQYTDLANNY
jgi:DNA modification methylase